MLDDVSIPLAANGQSSWFINEVFPAADTSDFAGSVRCTAPGEGMFTTLSVVPVPERMSQEIDGGPEKKSRGRPLLSEAHGRMKSCEA